MVTGNKCRVSTSHVLENRLRTGACNGGCKVIPAGWCSCLLQAVCIGRICVWAKLFCQCHPCQRFGLFSAPAVTKGVEKIFWLCFFVFAAQLLALDFSCFCMPLNYFCQCKSIFTALRWGRVLLFQLMQSQDHPFLPLFRPQQQKWPELLRYE